MSSSPLNIAIIGTGVFATANHLPNLKKQPENYKIKGCFNRTVAKAQEFAIKAGLNPESDVYESLESVFQDPEIDVVDALLPVQTNLDVVKLAIKYKKNLCLEKPIAANLEQAREIVKLSHENPHVHISVLEHWCYFKTIQVLKESIAKIGKVYSFTYHSTGQFDFNNKYFTPWRLNPQHIGGFLSDGGVHQLALLTGALGNIKSVSAHTKQIRELSGADDIAYSLMETESGVIGTFTYGSAFGHTDKSCYFQILGDNGSVYLNFSPKLPNFEITLKTGGKDAESNEFLTETIVIEDEYKTTFREFQVFAEAVKSDDFKGVLSTPDVTFHHLAIVDAILRSSKENGKPAEVTKP